MSAITLELFKEIPDSRPAGSFLTRLLSSFTTSGVREKHCGSIHRYVVCGIMVLTRLPPLHFVRE